MSCERVKFSPPWGAALVAGAIASHDVYSVVWRIVLCAEASTRTTFHYTIAVIKIINHIFNNNKWIGFVRWRCWCAVFCFWCRNKVNGFSMFVLFMDAHLVSYIISEQFAERLCRCHTYFMFLTNLNYRNGSPQLICMYNSFTKYFFFFYITI